VEHRNSTNFGVQGRVPRKDFIVGPRLTGNNWTLANLDGTARAPFKGDQGRHSRSSAKWSAVFYRSGERERT